MPGSASAAIGLGSTIAKGVIGNNAAQDAAQAQQQAAQQAQGVNQSVYQTNQSNLNPYIATGTSAQNLLGGLLGTNGSGAAANNAFQQYKNSTNYNFALNQGEQAIQYADAPSFNSSATAKSLNNYAQGMAGNTLNSYEGMLQGLGQQGQQGATSLGALGQQYAGTSASNLMAGGNAQAQGALGSAGAINNMIGGLASSFSPSSAASGTPGTPGYQSATPAGAGYNLMTSFAPAAQGALNSVGSFLSGL